MVLAEAFAASEERIVERVVETVVDRVGDIIVDRVEARLIPRMEAMIKQSEQNTAELITDFMGHVDARFNTIERQLKKLTKGYERIEDHSVRISVLEVKVGI